MPDEWKPEWQLCGGEDQCDFPPNPADPYDYDGKSVVSILQRCVTEDGNWLYMAVTPDGGVALAVEKVNEEDE